MTNMKKIQKIAAMLMVGIAAGNTLVLDGGNMHASAIQSSINNIDYMPSGKNASKVPSVSQSSFEDMVKTLSSSAAQSGMEKWRATDGAKYFESGKSVAKSVTKSENTKLSPVDYSLSALDSDESLSDVLSLFENSDVVSSVADKNIEDMTAQALMQKVQEAAADIGIKPTKTSIIDSIDTLFSAVNTKAVNTNTINANALAEVKDAMTASLMTNEGAAKEMQALANMVQEDVLQSKQLSDLSEFLMGLLQLAVDGARKVANVNNFYFQSSLPLLSLPVALDIFDALLPTWPVNFLSYDRSLASSHYVSGLKYTSELGKTVLDIFTTTL